MQFEKKEWTVNIHFVSSSKNHRSKVILLKNHEANLKIKGKCLPHSELYFVRAEGNRILMMVCSCFQPILQKKTASRGSPRFNWESFHLNVTFQFFENQFCTSKKTDPKQTVQSQQQNKGGLKWSLLFSEYREHRYRKPWDLNFLFFRSVRIGNL